MKKPDLKSHKQINKKTPVKSLEQLSHYVMICVAISVLVILVCVFISLNAQAKVNELTKNMTQVVMVTQHINKGQTISSAAVSVCEVPQSLQAKNTVTDISDVVGKHATLSLEKGTIISSSMVENAENGSQLSEKLSYKTQAVSIAVNDEQGIAQLLSIGDTVNVFAGTHGSAMNFSEIIKNARVIALDTSMETNNSNYSTVTLEVTQAQAQTIRQAQVSGLVLTLSLNAQSSQAGDK